MKAKTILGHEVPVGNPEDEETRMKMESINALTNMLQDGMFLLQKITLSATPFRGDKGDVRASVPAKLVREARMLVTKFKSEAKRWEEVPTDDVPIH